MVLTIGGMLSWMEGGVRLTACRLSHWLPCEAWPNRAWRAMPVGRCLALALAELTHYDYVCFIDRYLLNCSVAILAQAKSASALLQNSSQLLASLTPPYLLAA